MSGTEFRYQVLKTLAHLEEVNRRAMSPAEIADDSKLDKQEVSDHLEIMEKDGLVKLITWRGDNTYTFVASLTAAGRILLRELARQASPLISSEDLKHQQGLLAIHRRNLAHLVNQAVQYGGETFAPPIVVNSIGEARENIRRIKQILRSNGVTAADETNDEPVESQRAPVAPIGGTHITIQGGDYIAGDRQTEIDQRGQTVQGTQSNIAGPTREGSMSVFDQRGQHVNYQYNAAGDINFGAVQNKVDLVGELKKLKAEIGKAGDAQVIDAEVVTDVEYQITKAVQEAKKPEPKKETILERIDGAKKLIEGVAAAGGMVTALIKAAELVQKFF